MKFSLHRSVNVKAALQAVGADVRQARRLPGSTSDVYYAPDVDLVLKLRRDSDRRAAHAEIALAQWLASELSFVRPTTVLTTLPQPVTVWEAVRPAATTDSRRLGEQVRRLHQLTSDDASDAGVSLNRLDDFSELRVIVEHHAQAGTVSQAHASALRFAMDRLEAATTAPAGSVRVAHGDLHLGNVIWTDNGCVLCDVDEIGLADPCWDTSFLVDPGRRSRLSGDGLRSFEAGYGAKAPPPEIARAFAQAAHLRRTVRQLAFQSPRDRYWNAIRLQTWLELKADPDADILPAVDQVRRRQVIRLARGLRS